MPIRIYQPIPLTINTSVQLDTPAAHHVARVLRAHIGDELTLFNGQGGEYAGSITHIDKKTVTVALVQYSDKNTESPLDLCLVQGISRGEKMDYTIQKAVELGVKQIIPLLTERCNVKLDAQRREKRWQHWQSIIISACEQSGRNFIPDIAAPMTYDKFLKQASADWKFVLAPHAENKLSTLAIPNHSRVLLLIGPEGGLSDVEITQAIEHQFISLNLGPRVLRTETAAVAAIAALQCVVGDMG